VRTRLGNSLLEAWPAASGRLAALAIVETHLRGRDLTHAGLVSAFAAQNAPLRETDAKWCSAGWVAFSGEVWFWAGLLAASLPEEDRILPRFRKALHAASDAGWGDRRLHTRVIRCAPWQSPRTPRAELQAHPLLRLARLLCVSRFPHGAEMAVKHRPPRRVNTRSDLAYPTLAP
jgi:hypothetical protein